MKNKELYKIHVKGRVQGVGFRWSAAREAGLRGISGFVKNMSDGSVYIEAEGEKEMLDDYVGWCRTGPRMSVVESVEVKIFPPSGFTEFSINH